MMVEVATTESFSNARAMLPVITALPESDFTAKLLLDNLPAGQDIFYRVKFRDLSHTDIVGEPVIGRFRTAPADRRDVSFVWGGDVAGQGWGINADDGGMVTFATMRKHNPDFLIHSGDTIYADGPILPETKLPDGAIWKNTITVPEKAKVAETLDEFRAAHKYNLLDDNVRAFNAQVPIFGQWDDHEVTNNWSLSKQLPSSYKERDITLLAARGARAFHEMYPISVNPNRTRPRLSHAQLRPASRCLHAGRAQLSRAQRPESAGELWSRCVFHRPGADGLAEARPDGLEGDLEGHRLRTCRSASSSMTTLPTKPGLRPSRRATGQCGAASWKLPISCASSNRPVSATRSG